MKKIKKKIFRERGLGIHVIVVFILLSISSLLFYTLVQDNKHEKIAETKPLPISRKVEAPSSGALLGISFDEQNFGLLLTIEQKLQKHFALVGAYQAWGSRDALFNNDWAESIADHGSIPFITWEPWKAVSGYDRSEEKVYQKDYKLSNISNGKFDPYIMHYAKAVKLYRKKVMIRFAHEMNGNWYSWGSTFNTPQEYIAAWRHVHDIFVKEGASNATWVWSPNAIYKDPHVPYADQVEKFYPGDAYVDWVGLSAFNWAGKYKKNVWIYPEALYAPTVQALSKFHKPILITETASADSFDSSLKAKWIEKLATYVKNTPKIKGVIWFNTQDNGIDWRLDSTQDSLHSFQNAFDQYFY